MDRVAAAAEPVMNAVIEQLQVVANRQLANILIFLVRDAPFDKMINAGAQIFMSAPPAPLRTWHCKAGQRRLVPMDIDAVSKGKGKGRGGGAAQQC